MDTTFKTKADKCFHCGEPICDRGAIRFGSAADDSLTITFHDECAIEIAAILKSMGERGIVITSRN